MADKENLVKIRSLLESIASRNTPFLTKCSETKLLAYSNLDEAHSKYRVIAQQALDGSQEILNSEPKCKEKLLTAKSILERESISSDLLDALSSLRTTYLNEILKPAVKGYLTSGTGNRQDVEKLYEKVFALDGLIEVAQFFDRVDSL
ncbi:MAG: hypothetical protein ACFFED_12410 [Candidatus Thorarchaeota archaeon]